MVIFQPTSSIVIMALSAPEFAALKGQAMDTEYFLQAMSEWEQRTGKKCIMSNVDTATFSALLSRAQQLKEAAKNGTGKNS